MRAVAITQCAAAAFSLSKTSAKMGQPDVGRDRFLENPAKCLYYHRFLAFFHNHIFCFARYNGWLVGSFKAVGGDTLAQK